MEDNVWISIKCFAVGSKPQRKISLYFFFTAKYPWINFGWENALCQNVFNTIFDSQRWNSSPSILRHLSEASLTKWNLQLRRSLEEISLSSCFYKQSVVCRLVLWKSTQVILAYVLCKNTSNHSQRCFLFRPFFLFFNCKFLLS